MLLSCRWRAKADQQQQQLSDPGTQREKSVSSFLVFDGVQTPKPWTLGVRMLLQQGCWVALYFACRCNGMDNVAVVSLGPNSTTVSSNTKSSRRCDHDHNPLCRAYAACCSRLLVQETPARSSEQIMLKPLVDP